jgi:hypothetical protein
MQHTLYVISARATVMLAFRYLLQGRRMVYRKVLFRYVQFKGKAF